MNEDDRGWMTEYEVILRPYLPALAPDRALVPDEDLNELGLDSLGSVGLLMAVEDAFAIAIPDDKLTMATFKTPRTLMLVVQTQLEAARGRGNRGSSGYSDQSADE